MNHRCSKCHQVKNISHFYLNRRNIYNDQLNYQCIECISIYRKNCYRKHNTYRYQYHKNPYNRFTIYKGEAKRKQLIFELDKTFFDNLSNQSCYYCGRLPNNGEMIGIDRVNNNLGYIIGNCVPCCSECNYAKRFRSDKAFIEHCERVTGFQKSKITNSKL